MKYMDPYDRVKSLEAESHVCGKWTQDKGGNRKKQGKETD